MSAMDIMYAVFKIKDGNHSNPNILVCTCNSQAEAEDAAVQYNRMAVRKQSPFMYEAISIEL